MADTTAKSAAGDAAGFDERLARGAELLRQDQVQDAAAALREALELRPDDERALGLLGLSYFRLASFAEAREIYERLVAMRGDDASYRLNLGLVHLKMERPAAAIAELVRSQELDPGQSRTVSYLGLAYARSGQYALAYESFLRAGQSGLASEMEQHLGEAERREIAARVAGDDALEADTESEPPTVAGSQASEAGRAAEEAAPQPLESERAAAVVAGEAEGGGPEEAAEQQAADPEPEPSPVPEAPAGAAEEAAPASAAEEAEAAPASAAEGVITRAVADARPALVAAAARTAAGHRPPQPLAEFASAARIRPEEGDHAFSVAAGGALVTRVDGRIFSRTEGVVVSSGELGFEAATRRVRGAQTSERLGGDEGLFAITGKGYLIAAPGAAHFAALRLDDDILYLREELVFGFEEQLRWESGHVPGRGDRIRVVQFRGTGCLALRASRPLLSLALGAERVMYVDAEVLAGWVGRVIPRLVEPAAGGRRSTPFVECSGEGVVLVHDPSADESARP